MSETFALPVDENSKRVRIEEGEYKATCIAVHPPARYIRYQRMFRRVDFAIHGDGSIVSKYVNMAAGDKINIRSDYYKFWVMAMGRKHESGELLDLGAMVGKEFLVTVKDKVHADGDVYSVVTTLRLFALGSMLCNQCSSLNTQISTLSNSALCNQCSVTQDSGTQHSATQGHSGTQGDSAPRRRRPGLPPDVSALVLPSGDTAQG